MAKKINFITEIASTHNGQLNLVKFLSDAHLKTGSKFLKYQIFKTKNLYDKKNINYKKYKTIEINFNNWKKLINNYSKKTNLILEPFDYESYIFCKQFKKKVLLKIATSETDNFDLIKDALSNFKRIFLNISGYSFYDVKKIIFLLKKNKFKKKIIFMYGFQAYPTRLKDLRFDLFSYLKKKNFNYGYADHTKHGISNELLNATYKSIKLGCSYIEKHICKNIAKKPHDYISALEPEDFKNYMEKVHKLDIYKKKNLMKKQNIFKMSKAEKIYAQIFHKQAFAKKDIYKKTFINLSDLYFLRSDFCYGIKRLEISYFTLKSKINFKKNLIIDRRKIIFKKK